MSEREKRIGNGRSGKASRPDKQSRIAPSTPQHQLATTTGSRIRVLDQAFAELSHHTSEEVAHRDDKATSTDMVDHPMSAGDAAADARPATPTPASSFEQAIAGAANMDRPQQAVASRTAARLDAPR